MIAVANNLITFAVNVSLAPRIDAINSSENSRCLQSRRQISAIRYTYSQIMWFEPDDYGRVAINVVSFAINSFLHPSIVATNSVEKSHCLQFEPIMIAVHYT